MPFRNDLDGAVNDLEGGFVDPMDLHREVGRHGFHPGRGAFGMQRAWDSSIGLPNRSSNALWMLGFLIPEDVRR